MTFTCNEPEGRASVMGLNIATGKAVNYTNAPGTYNEVEAIFPDEQYAAVEADRQCRELKTKKGAEVGLSPLALDRRRLPPAQAGAE